MFVDFFQSVFLHHFSVIMVMALIMRRLRLVYCNLSVFMLLFIIFCLYYINYLNCFCFLTTRWLKDVPLDDSKV